ncbi:hypothetical protein HDU80_003886, partial [Chytriomyces hyalinus]
MSDDWDSVTVIRKRAQNPTVVKSQSAINAALRSGAQIITEKKAGGTYDAAKMGKVENEGEVSIPKVLFSHHMSRANANEPKPRLLKNWERAKKAPLNVANQPFQIMK